MVRLEMSTLLLNNRFEGGDKRPRPPNLGMESWLFWCKHGAGLSGD